MRLLVCGGTKYGHKKQERELILLELESWFTVYPNLEIIEGAAPGVDTIAGQWASLNGIPRHTFPANWSRCGKAAGPFRNTRMLVQGKPDRVLAFPGDKGTQNMMAQAIAAGVPVHKGRIYAAPDTQKAAYTLPKFSECLTNGDPL